MRAKGAQQFSFEGHTLDLRRGCLSRQGRDVQLRPKSFQVLRYLVENAGRLVSKDEIVHAVWPNVVVSDEGLARCISDVRLALGDAEQRIIKTIPRRGYLLSVPVERRVGAADDERQAEAPSPLSVVVLPFVNLGGGAAQDYFVDAVTTSLTTDLSHLCGAFIIASRTAFTYKGKTLDVRRIGRELKVRYVLAGTVLNAADRIRVTAQLVDAATGAQLWANRFDKRRADIFDLQDEITAWLARLVGIELLAAEGRRAERERPDAMDAFDFTMRGMAILQQPTTLENEGRARPLFEAALRLDPNNITALIGLATTHAHEVLSIASSRPAEQLRLADEAIAKASRLAPLSADAHHCRAIVAFASGAPDRALRDCEIAIGLHRGHASALAWRGWMKAFLGRGQETEADVSEAIRLVPRDPQLANWVNFLSGSNFFLGREDQAIEHGRKAVEINPNYHFAYFYQASALALAGRRAEAAEATGAWLRHNPRFTLTRLRVQPRSAHPQYLAQRQRLLEGLRLAGMPD